MKNFIISRSCWSRKIRHVAFSWLLFVFSAFAEEFGRPNSCLKFLLEAAHSQEVIPSTVGITHGTNSCSLPTLKQQTTQILHFSDSSILVLLGWHKTTN